jgi:hypothetical protein
MDLFLIPILLLGGAALVHMGINGAPQLQLQALSRFGGVGFFHWRGAARPRPVLTLAAPKELAPAITESDMLLADVLTEMLDLKSEFAELQGQVATLVEELQNLSQEKPAPARPRRQKHVA